MASADRLASVEKLLVQPLDEQRLLDPTADIMADHEFGQMSAVDEDDALAEIFGGFARRLGKGRGRDEQALGGLEPVEQAEKVADGAGPDRIAGAVSFGLDVDLVEAKTFRNLGSTNRIYSLTYFPFIDSLSPF